jgi:hypothetical protein
MHYNTSWKAPGSIPGGVTGDLSMPPDNSMCLGSTQPLHTEYQYTPGSKDGRCVWLTTNHLQVSTSQNLEALTSQNPLGSIGLQCDCFTSLYNPMEHKDLHTQSHTQLQSRSIQFQVTSDICVYVTSRGTT